MFTRRQITALLIPLMLEQMLSGMMGIVDTMMVTRVGESAISAVSLVDSINTLMLNLLAAMAAGGVIVCSQYLGRREREKANQAARQVLLISVTLSVAVSVVCLIFRRPLVQLIFGQAEQEVLNQAVEYFLVTALSYPFVAAQQTASAVFRASGHAAPPMAVVAMANVTNIIGNSVLIFGLGWGVVGAALSTLFSRVLSAVVLLAALRSPKLEVSIRDYARIRPDREMIGMVFRVGVPTGLENSMFQLGQLAVQSTVSTLGTAAMATQAMTQTLELVAAMPSQAIGIGLLTVAGQCMGAGRVDEAKRYTRQFCWIAEGILAVMSLFMVAMTPVITRVSGMGADSAAATFRLMCLIGLVKMVLWVAAFTLPNAMRAAGDVRFSASISALSMWVFRVGVCVVLCRGFHVGLIGVWIAWFSDWLFRVIVYVWRYRSGRWQKKTVIQ